MKMKLLMAAAVLGCGVTGVAKADSLSISVGLPPAHVVYHDYEPRRVYREYHHSHYAPPRVVYYQPRVVYRDVHYQHPGKGHGSGHWDDGRHHHRHDRYCRH